MSLPFERAALAALALSAIAACSSETPTPIGSDAAVAEDAQTATPIDGGGSAGMDATVMPQGDAAMAADDAATANLDAMAGNPDAMAPMVNELAPGSHVTIAGAGRIALGDAYSDVTGLLGRGTRSMGMAQRSYEWTLAGGVELTVWFTNSNLDNDDDPPNDVDPTDRVLWIAVGGTFAGRTPANVGVGSGRAAVVAAYGASPRDTALTQPTPGQLSAYYTRGFLVAYGQDGNVRTFTVCKAYGHAPDGRIDIPQTRLSFGNDNITARLIGGSSRDDIVRLFGPPDSEGAVPNQNDVDILNYAFIGFEALVTGDTAFTVIVHAPYYGTTGNNTPGLGASRTEFETYVQQSLMGSGPRASTRTMGVFCFTLAGRSFGVTYSTDMPQTVTGIILGPCQ